MSGLKVTVGDKPAELCKCCPYGFHIDVDFLNSLETEKDANPAKVVASNAQGNTKKSDGKFERKIICKAKTYEPCPKIGFTRSLSQVEDSGKKKDDLHSSIQDISNYLDKLLNAGIQNKIQLQPIQLENQSISNNGNDGNNVSATKTQLSHLQQPQVTSRILHRQNLMKTFGMSHQKFFNPEDSQIKLKKSLTCHDVMADELKDTFHADQTTNILGSVTDASELLKLSSQLKDVLNYFKIELKNQEENVSVLHRHLGSLQLERRCLHEKLCNKCKPLLDADSKNDLDFDGIGQSNGSHKNSIRHSFSEDRGRPKHSSCEIVESSSLKYCKSGVALKPVGKVSVLNNTQSTNFYRNPQVSNNLKSTKLIPEDQKNSETNSKQNFEQNSNFMKLSKLNNIFPKTPLSRSKSAVGKMRSSDRIVLSNSSSVKTPEMSGIPCKNNSDKSPKYVSRLAKVSQNFHLDQQTQLNQNSSSQRIISSTKPMSIFHSRTPQLISEPTKRVVSVKTIPLTKKEISVKSIKSGCIQDDLTAANKKDATLALTDETKSQVVFWTPRLVARSYSIDAGIRSRKMLPNKSMHNEEGSSSEESLNVKENISVVAGRREMKRTCRRSLSLVTSSPIRSELNSYRSNCSSSEDEEVAAERNAEYTDDQSSTSFDEGAYDGELGRIIYKQKLDNSSDV